MARSRSPPRREARTEELRPEVVVVEHEARSSQLQRQRDQEQQVGGIARLHHVERPLAIELDRQPQRVPERGPVFAQVARRAAGGGLERVAVDLHALDARVGLGIAPGSAGADDRDFVARLDERLALLPDAPVERHAEVLDEDQDARHRTALTRPRRGSHPHGRPARAAARGRPAARRARPRRPRSSRARCSPGRRSPRRRRPPWATRP